MTILEASPLDAALTYARRGWRVVPIKPGHKHPAVDEWQNAATVDEQLIHQWWQRWPDHGVGIVTGNQSGLFVLDVDIADGKRGDDTLADLEATHGRLPDTVEVVTGTGGRHLYFRMPIIDTVRNDAGRRLGPGLDVRGEGGQVLAPPTLHPNGNRYRWEASSDPDDTGIADPPRWLTDLLTAAPAPPPRPRSTPTVNGHRRPSDTWAETTSWADLLTADGATYLSTRTEHTTGQPYEMWARPGVDHASGTVGYRGSDVLKIFSSEWRVLNRDTGELVHLTEGATYTKFGYYTATRHDGDYTAAAASIANLHTGTDHKILLAQFLDEIAALETAQPAAPTQPDSTEPDAPQPDPVTRPAAAVRWVDTLHTDMPPEPAELVGGLLRRGELCVIGAPRAIGKTWLGYNLSILLDRGAGDFLGHLPILQRANVLYLQGELDQWGSATRWQMLTSTNPLPIAGATTTLPHVAETFDRLRIRTIRRRTTSTLDGVTFTDEHIDATIDDRIETAITEHNIDVVVVDPWAVYFAGSENSNDETEAALDKLRDITLRHGTAWVILHHIGKTIEYREPEDLWRGASRLADWASTRVTLLPHYTEHQRKEQDMTRVEARRHADVYFLRRSTPTDDFSIQLQGGWWHHWDPPDDEQTTGRPPAIATYEVVAALRESGGTWTSQRAAADALECSPTAAKHAIERAEKQALVTVDRGGNRGFIVTLATPDSASLDRAETTVHIDRAETLSDQSKTIPEQDF